MSLRTAQLVASLVDAWNAHDAERVVACLAIDYEGQDVSEAQPHKGPDGARRHVGRYLCAFPDLSLRADEVLASGNRVAMSWTARGTHAGGFLNIPASGREVTVRGMSLLTFRDDKVWRALHVWDVAGLLRGIGLLPDL